MSKIRACCICRACAGASPSRGSVNQDSQSCHSPRLSVETMMNWLDVASSKVKQALLRLTTLVYLSRPSAVTLCVFQWTWLPLLPT